jgi:hypothetical protein
LLLVEAQQAVGDRLIDLLKTLKDAQKRKRAEEVKKVSFSVKCREHEICCGVVFAGILTLQCCEVEASR